MLKNVLFKHNFKLKTINIKGPDKVSSFPTKFQPNKIPAQINSHPQKIPTKKNQARSLTMHDVTA